MTTYTVMKTNMRDEAIIPKLAIDSFRRAFADAVSSDIPVVFVSKEKIIEKQADGKMVELKNVSQAYVVPELKHTVLKRKVKRGVFA